MSGLAEESAVLIGGEGFAVDFPERGDGYTMRGQAEVIASDSLAHLPSSMKEERCSAFCNDISIEEVLAGFEDRPTRHYPGPLMRVRAQVIPAKNK